MKLCEFEEQNYVIAKDQPEYLPMPAHITQNEEGEIICCWQLTWKERIKLLITGKIWHSIWTFHQSLQPQMLSIEKPQMDGGNP
jgi:hypothetical protein